MRFQIDIESSSSIIPKDKNRMVLFIIKHCLDAYDSDFFQYVFKDHDTKNKNFTFAMYLKNAKFFRNTVQIESKIISVKISTYDEALGLILFKSMESTVGNALLYHHINLKIKKIEKMKEVFISENEVILKSLSPCVVRGLNREKAQNTYFFDLNTQEGKDILLNWMKFNLLNVFPRFMKEINEFYFEIIENHDVKVVHYNRVINSNIVTMKLYGEWSFLNYFYKAGIGSLRSSGFGMMNIIKK